MTLRYLACLLILLAFVPRLSAQGLVHPPVFVDEGACPGEGCSYGKWKVQKETILRARPNPKSEVVSKCRVGSEVQALTGQVHTVAGKFIVKKKHQNFSPGDVIWVYTYLGEGFFKVWFDGKFFEEELGFSPWGGSAGSRCEVEKECWGELEQELKFTWWVQIRNADGVIGWTHEPKNLGFSGK
jgi:hypothetical protein